MPLEGQAERVRTPLRTSDRRFLGLLGAVALVAIAAGLAYALSRPAATGRCVSFTIAESVGGATVHKCGAAARRYCRLEASEPQAVQACRRAGYAIGPG